MTKVKNTGPGKVATIGATGSSPMILLYNFNSGDDLPKKEHFAMIAFVGTTAKFASQSKAIRLRIDIEGYADSTGQTPPNLTLAKSRANSVKKKILAYGAPGSLVKIHPRGSDPKHQPSKASPYKALVNNQRISPLGGNELDRSAQIFLQRSVSLKELKPDFSKKGWDSVIQQAYDKALWSVLNTNLLDIAKNHMPLWMTGLPTIDAKVKAAMRKKTIDIIMEWAKRKGHGITRQQVEKEIDSRKFDISKK